MRTKKRIKKLNICIQEFLEMMKKQSSETDQLEVSNITIITVFTTLGKIGVCRLFTVKP